MRIDRSITAWLAAVLIAPHGAWAATGDEDGPTFARMLALAHVLVRAAADAPDGAGAQKGMEEILAGRNAEANRAAAGVLEEVTRDMPATDRAALGAFAQDLLRLARREQARAVERSAAEFAGAGRAEALAARKELNAMGLAYHDARQFLEAVKRDDLLAVELYVTGRGVNLGAHDADGRGALEIARAAGHRRMAELLAAARP